MAMNSELPVTEVSQEGPDLVAERLAYSVDEVAQLTGLSRDLLYDQMRRGNLQFVKVGRRRLITRQHLERFLGVASLGRRSRRTRRISFNASRKPRRLGLVIPRRWPDFLAAASAGRSRP
jgi:excisionase family DNA binding protein